MRSPILFLRAWSFRIQTTVTVNIMHGSGLSCFSYQMLQLSLKRTSQEMTFWLIHTPVYISSTSNGSSRKMSTRLHQRHDTASSNSSLPWTDRQTSRPAVTNYSTSKDEQLIALGLGSRTWSDSKLWRRKMMTSGAERRLGIVPIMRKVHFAEKLWLKILLVNLLLEKNIIPSTKEHGKEPLCSRSSVVDCKHREKSSVLGTSIEDGVW